MFENNFQEGNYTQRHNYNTKHFNYTLSTNCKGKWFFTIESARFSTNTFCSTSSFSKGSFEAKNSNMEKLQIRDLLFANCFFTFSFPWLLISLYVTTQWAICANYICQQLVLIQMLQCTDFGNMLMIFYIIYLSSLCP